MLQFNNRKKLIRSQYRQADLYDKIITGLRKKNINIENVTREDIASVDEFHIRGAEVSREFVKQFNFRNLKVLDVGCGLGGPSRMLADEYNCEVFGIDLNPDYIKTAEKLTKLVSTNGEVKFLVGDALNLPFKNESFDVVWTQHVQMNIEDKKLFYAEIYRVLNRGGVFVYYDIFKKDDQEINFPVPWANNKAISFLQTKYNMASILNDLGFVVDQRTNETEKAKTFVEGLLSKIDNKEVNELGLQLLLGDTFKVKFSNVLDALKTGKIMLEKGIYRKI